MSRTKIYDRQGQEISYEEFLKLSSGDYKRVRSSLMPDGRWISTIWLGLDHARPSNGSPIIFETLVFSADTNEAEEGERYSTEEEAVSGHARYVAKYNKGVEE